MQPIPRNRRRHRAIAATIALLFVTLVVPLTAPEPVAAQERGAVVRGASKVFVRRGPGMSFPPFARLAEGSVVQVKGQQGQWVRIMTTGGQMGFVNAKYLLMLDRESGEITPPAADEEAPAEAAATPPAAVGERAAEAPTVAPTRAPAATPTAARARQAAAEPTPAEPVLQATEPATKIPRLPPPEPARATMAEERAAIVDEVRRLSDSVTALQRRIEENEPIANGFAASGADDGSSVSGGAILLGLLGVGVGWYLGSRYGRAQERGRRSRIRF